MMLLDVNVLIYAHNRAAEQHATDRAWLEAAVHGPRPIGLPLVTALGFVRIGEGRPTAVLEWIDGTHPVVYVASHAHASYPEPTDLGLGGSCPNEDRRQGLFDRADGQGAVWRPWETGLRLDRAEGWYGFGDAWGEVTAGPLGDSNLFGSSNGGTGPVGPPHKDPGTI